MNQQNQKNNTLIIIIGILVATALVLIGILAWQYFRAEEEEREASKEVLIIEEKIITDLNLINTFDINWNIVSVYILNDYAFLGIALVGLQIIDISNPANPILLGIYRFPEDGRLRWERGVPCTIHVSGNYAFLNYRKGLKIIDISDPSNPFLAGYYKIGSVSDIHAFGNYVFVTEAFRENLHIIDISDPANPFLVTLYPTYGGWNNIYIVDNYLFMTDRKSLRIIDISDPTNSFLVSNHKTEAADDVYVSGNYAFLLNENIFEIINISNPANPILVSNYKIDGVVGNIYIAGNYAFLMTSTPYIFGNYYTISVIDISNPANPFKFINLTDPFDPIIKTSFYELPNRISSFVVSGNRMHVSGDYIYVIAGRQGLQIIRINKEPKEDVTIGIKPREWVAILGQSDIDNDGAPEIFGLIREGEQPDLKNTYYVSAVSWNRDKEKLVENWRNPQSISHYTYFPYFDVLIGDLDGNRINEILIEIIKHRFKFPTKSSAILFEYGRNDYKINDLTSIINEIMDEKVKDIDDFYRWSYKEIEDYDQDGIKEIVIEVMVDRWEPRIDSTILITWEDILKNRANLLIED